MVRVRLVAAAALALYAGTLTPQSPRLLTQRVWLLGGVPHESVLDSLRAGGVAGFVLPVGEVELGEGSSKFSLARLPDLSGLAGWQVTPLVWVSGSGANAGDPGGFAVQFVPVQQGIRGSEGLILASRSFFPGLAGFASGVAARLGRPVELALPAQALAQQMPPGGWPKVRPVAVAFGNPSALGLPSSTLQDDLIALDSLDTTRVPYRAAIVVAPRAEPRPGPAGASLSSIASVETASFTPGVLGDVFRLRRPVDWGGVTLPAGQSITVETVDTAMYHRDLGMLLRPVRPRLQGWDTVGLPDPEPALGMSREAFVEYLAGAEPYAHPKVDMEAVRPTMIRVTLANPTAQASGLATTGNWVEIRFTGTELRDVQLGEFTGVEYGKLGGDGAWHLTAAREATAVRLYLTLVAPKAHASGLVTFLTPPREVTGRWNLRLGDGTDVTGPLKQMAVSKH
jgi:hypothetical protein